MSRNAKGFTLIELMIVIAIIAIIAAIAIPNLLAARLSANETAAIATLRNIISSQAQFQQGAKADTDNDGSGEYGGFVELSGGGAGRMLAILNPPVLSGAFLTLAIVIGEFTIASLLNRPVFGVYMQNVGANRAFEPSALAIVSFVVTWVAMGMIQLLARFAPKTARKD